jgi:D-alanyl-D-alanine carboxypeptidase
MRTTKRNPRQARAASARGRSDPGSPARHSVRVFAAATAITLVVSLAPRITQAPTQADEPIGLLGGTTTRATQPIGLIAGAEPAVEPILPPSRPADTTATAPARTQTATAEAVGQFQAALDTARYAAAAYGVTFAAVRDGQIVWAGSSGVERDGSTRLRPDSSMVIGSITKTFVAASILQLVEEGRLALEDSVRTHLPELTIVSREITIRQLLDHTSGLADVFNDTTRRGLEEDPERPWSSSQLFTTLHAPWYQPGEGWAYANTNYYLLGMIVERVTGSTLEAELARRFVDRYDLAATRVLSPDDPTSPLSPAWTTIFWSSGNMVSSAGDLARWGDALYDRDVRAVLDADTGRSMLGFNRDDYGLGVKRFEELAPQRAYGHTGLLNTYTSMLVHVPRANVTLAILVNRTNVDLFGMLRARPAFGGPSLLRLSVDS